MQLFMVTLGRGLCRYGSCVLYAHGYVDKLYCFDWLNGYVHIQFIGIYGGRCVVGQITNYQEVIETALVDQINHECCDLVGYGAAGYGVIGFKQVLIADDLQASTYECHQACHVDTIQRSGRALQGMVTKVGYACARYERDWVDIVAVQYITQTLVYAQGLEFTSLSL